MKSKSDRYGAVAITLHWLTAILIPVLLISGFRAAQSVDPAAKAAILRFHIPVAIAVLVLTLLRLAWWFMIDRRPEHVAGTKVWEARLASAIHYTLYLIVLGLLVTGVGIVLDSGAAPAILGRPGAVLPNFELYPPRFLHGALAKLLIALVLTHVIAALSHHFIRRDGLLWRMWYGG